MSQHICTHCDLPIKIGQGIKAVYRGTVEKRGALLDEEVAFQGEVAHETCPVDRDDPRITQWPQREPQALEGVH